VKKGKKRKKAQGARTVDALEMGVPKENRRLMDGLIWKGCGKR